MRIDEIYVAPSGIIGARPLDNVVEELVPRHPRRDPVGSASIKYWEGLIRSNIARVHLVPCRGFRLAPATGADARAYSFYPGRRDFNLVLLENLRGIASLVAEPSERLISGFCTQQPVVLSARDDGDPAHRLEAYIRRWESNIRLDSPEPLARIG